jgi:hypothetical protein
MLISQPNLDICLINSAKSGAEEPNLGRILDYLKRTSLSSSPSANFVGVERRLNEQHFLMSVVSVLGW